MVQGTYVKDGELQPGALLTRELAGKCQLTCAPLTLPARTEGINGGPSKDLPYDYYTSKVSIKYPDGSVDKSFYIPEVYLYDLPQASGPSTTYPLGLSTDLVAYFDPMLKRMHPSAFYGDRKFSATPDIVWSSAKVYLKDTSKSDSRGIEIEASGPDKSGGIRIVHFDDMNHMFESSKSVCVIANITCTMRIQAQVTKGTEMIPGTEAKAVLVPNKINIIRKANVPKPETGSVGRRTITNAQDKTDPGLFEDLINSAAAVEDEDEDEDEDDD